MPCDNELVDCVGRENVIKICNELGCISYDTCIPHGAQTDLCDECYTEIRKKYPECGRSV